MDTSTFYSARKVTHVSTLAEVNKTMENAKNIVILDLGVDLMDRLWEAYHSTIRGKNGFGHFFVNLLNTTVVAAWKTHCQIGDKKITHIDFKRQVTLCLFKVQQHREIESIVAAELPLDVRFDGVNHFLGPATTQSRCKVCKKIEKVCAPQNATFVCIWRVARLVS